METVALRYPSLKSLCKKAAMGQEALLELRSAELSRNIHENVGSEDMLVGCDTHRLKIAGGLELRRGSRGILELGELLKLIVGDFIAREFVAEAEGQAVAGRDIAVIA